MAMLRDCKPFAGARSGRNLKTASAAALVLALAVAPVNAGDDCALLPNGTFADGLAGWTLTPHVEQSGGGFGGFAFDIVDGSIYAEPMDGQVLQMSVGSVVNGPKSEVEPPASANATLTLSRIVPITDRYLAMRIGGGFEILRFGTVEAGLSARVEIEPAPSFAGDRPMIEHEIYSLQLSPWPDCDIGMSVLGAFGNTPPVNIDVLEHADGTPTGLNIDDFILLRVIVNANAVADLDCDEAEVSVALAVDEFRFCAQPAGPFSDINQDGVVNIDDLFLVLEAWGPCGKAPRECPADLDFSGDVGIDDLFYLLSQWS